jgi:hypothetical protein
MIPLIFNFEQDFQETLHCIPMAVRCKLDVAGIKLKLGEWLKLSEEERGELLSSPSEVFAERVRHLVEAKTGQRPGILEVPKTLPWEDVSQIPSDLLSKAQTEGVPLTLSVWAVLSPLQRFALIKLSRPSHENKNFQPACREFGLAK